MADIFAMLDRAADLFDEATEIYNRVKPSIDNVGAEGSDGLAAARIRLEQSMARAQQAHASLDDAITQRLGE